MRITGNSKSSAPASRLLLGQGPNNASAPLQPPTVPSSSLDPVSPSGGLGRESPPCTGKLRPRRPRAEPNVSLDAPCTPPPPPHHHQKTPTKTSPGVCSPPWGTTNPKNREPAGGPGRPGGRPSWCRLASRGRCHQVPPAEPLETAPPWMGAAAGLWAPSLENCGPGDQVRG